jgi:hypothetical protein
MNMKLIALFLLTLAVLPAIAFAVPKSVSTYDGNAKPNGNAGKSTVGHLYLVEKDPTTWAIVQDGSWGKMNYNTKNSKFDFNGHKLTPSTSYSLIYYPDPWPGAGCKLLGTGTTNKGGNVHIKGTFDFSSIPIATDANVANGAKIWLVSAADVNCLTGMTAWNPTEYLFEYSLI